MSLEPFEPVETERLLLRCVLPADATATSALITSEISRWLASWPFPYTPEMAANRIESMRDLAYEGNALPLAVVTKYNGKLAGWATVSRDFHQRRRGSFGYWLGEQCHGNGFMKEAAPVALGLAFKLMNLDVIEAGAQPENVGSLAIMRLCGMKMIGERMLFAPARNRSELCRFYEIERLATAY